MKNFIFLVPAATMVFFFFHISLQAQTTATWQGGKAGNPSDWNCAANWKEGRTPNEFSVVIIPTGKAFYPNLKTEVLAIDALLVEGEAVLILQSGGRLTILNETGCLNGITLLGTIQNDGVLEIRNVDKLDTSFLEQLHGSGVVVDRRLSSITR